MENPPQPIQQTSLASIKVESFLLPNLKKKIPKLINFFFLLLPFVHKVKTQ